MNIPLHEGCGNVVTLKENVEDLHHSCTKITQSTLELIIQNPNITIKELSETLGLSEKTIKNRLALLKKEGIIVRVGSRTSGYWEVVGYMEE